MMPTVSPIKVACIIDDDEIYVHLIKKIIKMKKLSEELLVFSNGQEALTYFEALPEKPTVSEQNTLPQIILLDLNMPVMDGWDFLEKYKNTAFSKNPKSTLYIVSSSIDPYEMEKAKSIDSVTDYLIKPISIEHFQTIFNKTV
ncbi:response regulator [Ulvibacter litoralis]|uniref:Response regulator receiver domain-containing protein n=1 Tax=Ulvibacter litoralis TaxID=227084 RepID=A0A1G7D082_9FLAO|nr:response regulator [Ulvibacter litoralis]GHC45405.1 response regulator [Ulvibacter litoralis]SDE44937.1 Response regulator receiver domain-containing protein [Ulvibacter litoralis]